MPPTGLRCERAYCTAEQPRRPPCPQTARTRTLSQACCAMSLAFDEYGRPFIIIRDQEGKSRMKVRCHQSCSLSPAPLCWAVSLLCGPISPLPPPAPLPFPPLPPYSLP
eukprot:COSAG05_NODE_239_length_13139_cov_14.870475_1_plen_108_part_10